MSEHKRNPEWSGEQGAARELSEDLRALEAASRRGTPSIHETHQLFERVGTTREGSWMSFARQAGQRPWWIPVGATASLAIALLFVPFSFQKTIGQSVSFELAADTDRQTIDEIARALSEGMGADEIDVSAGDPVRITSEIPKRSAAEVRAMTAALVGTLENRGVSARAEVNPITERISGTVYAFAANSFSEITVRIGGRSAFEIENDLRAELQRIGFLNPEVEYSQDGAESRVQIQAQEAGGGKIQAEFRHQAVDASGQPISEPQEMNLMMLDTAELKGKSDAEIQRIVEDQLRAKGITDADVTVQNGEVKIERHQDKRIGN